MEASKIVANKENDIGASGNNLNQDNCLCGREWNHFLVQKIMILGRRTLALHEMLALTFFIKRHHCPTNTALSTKHHYCPPDTSILHQTQSFFSQHHQSHIRHIILQLTPQFRNQTFSYSQYMLKFHTAHLKIKEWTAYNLDTLQHHMKNIFAA